VIGGEDLLVYAEDAGGRRYCAYMYCTVVTGQGGVSPILVLSYQDRLNFSLVPLLYGVGYAEYINYSLQVTQLTP
jgi:hypothetical protein